MPQTIYDIPLIRIVIGDRQRKDMGDIASLQFSIEHHGLLNPIILSKRTDGRFDLIAGERRLICFSNLGRTTIPAILKEELPDVERAELEYEENLKRKNLTWREEVKAIVYLHRAKMKKHEQLLSSQLGGRWSQKDTAREIQLSESIISQSLTINDFLEKNADAFEGVISRADAIKVARKLSAGAIYETDKKMLAVKESLHFETFEESLSRLDAYSVDLLVADLSGEDFTIIGKMRQKLKPTGQGFVFINIDEVYDLLSYFESNRIPYRKKPFIWYIRGEDDYQFFFWFSQMVKEPLKDIRTHFSFKRDQVNIHSKEKPEALFVELLMATTFKGYFCWEPFSYSPNFVLAANLLQRNIIASCQDKILFEQILMRMGEKK